MLTEEKLNRLEDQITEEKKTVDFDTREFTIEFLVKKYLENLETGENDMKPYVIERLADYFGVSISYFLKMSDSPDGNDKPTGFDSVEEYEKARKIFLETLGKI